MNNAKGISLGSMRSTIEVEDFYNSYYRNTGEYPHFELSYQMNSQNIRDVSFIKGQVLSGHAPCPGGEYLPNLGSRESSIITESLETLKKSAETIASFGGSILVLHAGYTMDGPVYTEYSRRKSVLEEYEKTSRHLWLKEGSICKPGYAESDEYRIHMDETLKNLKTAAVICAERGVRLAVENLNPRLTYLFQMPEDFIRMTEEAENLYICIDIGHLWISSLVHGFVYSEALELLVSTNRVVSTHIHDNRSISGESPQFSDDHGTIGTGMVPIRDSVLYLLENSSTNLIIEAASSPMRNMILLDGMIKNPD